MNNNLFLQMLQLLRQQEEVLLFGNMLDITATEEAAAAQFLASEYETESLNYPHTAPPFDAPAALWGARTVYLSAQLLLYRENKVADLAGLLPPYEYGMTAAAMVSGDLCLRFLPFLLEQLQVIDPEDPLIGVLEEHLHTWHYSGVSYPLETEKLDFGAVTADKCLHQLYADRITARRKLALAQQPVFKDLISSNLGIFKESLWKEFLDVGS